VRSVAFGHSKQDVRFGAFLEVSEVLEAFAQPYKTSTGITRFGPSVQKLSIDFPDKLTHWRFECHAVSKSKRGRVFRTERG
jgi:hypothetical protein